MQNDPARKAALIHALAEIRQQCAEGRLSTAAACDIAAQRLLVYINDSEVSEAFDRLRLSHARR